MAALLSIFMIPFIWLTGLLFPAQPAPDTPGTQDNAPFWERQPFVMPPKDSPYYEDLPWVTPWEWTTLPQADLGRLMEDYRALPAEEQTIGELFELFGGQLIENDFQLVLSTWPRVALVFDVETGTFSGLTDEGVFHLGFDYNIHDFFFPTRNPWMRLAGYTPFYDWLGGALGMFDIGTVRVDFPYNGLDYRIQLWKGQYFFDTTSGCEVGIYTKPPGRATEFYDCYPLDKMMPMSVKFYSADELYFDLEPEEHW